ncbi:hypothetical protein [Leucobacter sp. M11]|nr:hypothetical protein [Leucobacter sp. M11]MEB4616694.1 hypothetical protein [Leucobacter sp. M11]
MNALRERGCPKVMLMVRPENTGVIAAYAGMGSAEEPGLVVMGKRLIHDD